MIIVRLNRKVLSSDGQDKREIPFVAGESVKYYLDKSGFDHSEMSIILSGKCITDIEIGVVDGDEISIAPKIGMDPATWTAFCAFMWQVFIALCITIIVSAIMYGISLLIARRPKKNTSGEGIDDGSQTYSWDGIRTTQQVGTPVPVVYGEHMVGGNIINAYITDDGEKSYLDVLLALCEGEIDSIVAVQVNNNPVENYTGITYQSALGTNTQAPLSNFELLHDLHSVNQALNYGAPITYTMVGTSVQGLDVYVQLPSGLYQADSSGNILAWNVDLKIEYKLHSGSSWTTALEPSINTTSRTTLNRRYQIRGLASGKYDVRVTKTSPDSTLTPVKTGDAILSSIDEITNEDLAYPNTALIGIQALATDQLNGVMPNFGVTIKGRKVQVPDVKYSGASVSWADYYHDGTNYKRFSDDVICTWDGTTYITAWSANPVWCLRDLLVNTRFGLGQFIDATMIDTPSFLSMSQYCEQKVPNGSGGYEKRLRLDIVLDSSTRALDAVLQIATTFRGLVLYSGGTLKVKIDKPDSAVQLFGMGNIVEGSFQQSWVSIRDRYNVVQAQYLDKNQNYVMEKVAISDDVALANGDPMRVQDMKIFTTSITQAFREARFVLWKNKYIKRGINFKAGIDAVCCEAGDIINVSHDVPQWGYSGRIASGTSNTVVLDQSVTLLPGKTYKVMIRHSDDTIEEKLVTTGTGTTNTLTIQGTFTTSPSIKDVYSFGETLIEVKPFRIMNMKVNNDFTVEITAVEYDSRVYDDNPPSIPEVRYSALSGAVPPVTNLSLTERLVVLGDGTIQDCLDVWWQKPDASSVYVMPFSNKVYLSDNAGLSWNLVGETTGTNFSIIGNLLDGTSYKVAVVSIGADGRVNDIASAPQASITLVGKSAPPGDVSQFLLNQSRDRLYFSWTPVTDMDAFGYEIRYGNSWEGGQVIATRIRASKYLDVNMRTGSGQQYWIKAIDTSGNYSTNATEALVTIDNIPFQNIIQNYAEETAWSGTKTDCSKVGDNLELDTNKLSGIYVTPSRDIGYVASFGIRINTVVVDASADTTFDGVGDATWADDDTARFSGAEVSGAVSFEIKTSEDNITWSAWMPWQAGDYKCRYFQLRMTLVRVDVGRTIRCSAFDYYADLPDVVDRGTGTISSASSGLAVTFSKTFHQSPNIQINILSGSGLVYNFSVAPSTTGFTVKVYDLSGVAQTGNINWVAHGI